MTNDECRVGHSTLDTRHSTFLLIRTTANRQVVVHVSDEAARHGIRPGMMVAQARAMCASIELIEHEPDRDQVALEALARWMLRFTPIVAIGECRVSKDDCRMNGKSGARVQPFSQGERLIFEGVSAHPRQQLRVKPDSHAARSTQHAAIFLDLTGSQYVFGGYQNILGQLALAMKRFGVRANIVAAPTVGAAYALTFDDRWNGKVLPPAISRNATRCASSLASKSEDAQRVALRLLDVEPYLDPLPPFTLRIDDATAAALTHLGITSIRLLRKLPRDQLPARFGPLLLKRLNQALGIEPEPLTPIRPIESIASGVEFDFGVDSLESLWGVIREHLDQIVQRLIRIGHGARVIEFDLLLQNRPAITQTIELSRPSRDPKRLLRLVRITLEQLASDQGSARASPSRPRKSRARDLFGDRFTGVRFRVIQSFRIREDQITLLDCDDLTLEASTADLLERLQLRLKDCVTQAHPIESHLPERAWSISSPTSFSPRRHGGTEKKRGSTNLHELTRIQFKSFVKIREDSWMNSSSVPPYLRGEFLPKARPISLTDPNEIFVIVSPSHDRDGRPIGVTMEGRHHRVNHARGPERIAGEWWAGRNKTRDYFDIELDNARRLWVFRVIENGRWFSHGEFA